MATISESITDEVNIFINRINPNPRISFKEIILIQDYWEDKYRDSWANQIGIYFFINDTEYLYVGRALKNMSFGRRIESHTDKNRFSVANEWGAIIRSPETKILLYTFEDRNEDYWISALELLLFDKFDPKYNVRRGRNSSTTHNNTFSKKSLLQVPARHFPNLSPPLLHQPLPEQHAHHSHRSYLRPQDRTSLHAVPKDRQ